MLKRAVKEFHGIQNKYIVPVNDTLVIDMPYCGYESILVKYHVFARVDDRVTVFEINTNQNSYNMYGILGDHLLVDIEPVFAQSSISLQVTNNESTDVSIIVSKYREESYGLRVGHDCIPTTVLPNTTSTILTVTEPTKIHLSIGDIGLEMLALPNGSFDVYWIGDGSKFDVSMNGGDLNITNNGGSSFLVEGNYTRLDELCSSKTFDVTIPPNTQQTVDISFLVDSEAVKWIFGTDTGLYELTALNALSGVHTNMYFVGNQIDVTVSLMLGDRLVLNVNNDTGQPLSIKGTQLKIVDRCS